MRNFLLILLFSISISIAVSHLYTPINFIYNNSIILTYGEIDMKYHDTPYYYWTFTIPDFALACFFKPGDFGITGFDYRIKIIGFIGNKRDGPADIYVTSKESNYVPVCNPKNNWQGKDYGPKSWHINNSYLNYDDCNLYDDNWHYSKDVDKFWCIYHLKTASPPHPMSDNNTHPKNSATWNSGSGFWESGACIKGYDWCMHCVIVYWPEDIENTSLGIVKALFR